MVPNESNALISLTPPESKVKSPEPIKKRQKAESPVEKSPVSRKVPKKAVNKSQKYNKVQNVAMTKEISKVVETAMVTKLS